MTAALAATSFASTERRVAAIEGGAAVVSVASAEHCARVAISPADGQQIGARGLAGQLLPGFVFSRHA